MSSHFPTTIVVRNLYKYCIMDDYLLVTNFGSTVICLHSWLLDSCRVSLWDEAIWPMHCHGGVMGSVLTTVWALFQRDLGAIVNQSLPLLDGNANSILVA